MATLKQVLVSKFKSAWQNLNLPRFKGSFLHCCRYWDKRKCIEINIEALNFSVILLGKFLHLRLKSCLMMNLAKLKVDLENRSFFLVSLISQVSKLKNGQDQHIFMILYFSLYDFWALYNIELLKKIQMFLINLLEIYCTEL